MPETVLWIILAVGYLLTWLMIPWVLLKRTTHASAAVAWILTVVFLPFLGALLCALVGKTRWERHTPRRRRAAEHINRAVPPDGRSGAVRPDHVGEWSWLARLIEGLSGAPVTASNEIEVWPDTARSVESIVGDIRRARHWIHIEFYIWQQDRLGLRIRDLLIERARAGVEVRFLYDGIGSMLLTRRFLKPMRDAGVRIAPFTPGFRLWHLLSLNLRNHRKLVITDGEVGSTGGMNIGDEHIHPTDSYGEWRDTQVRVRGPAVRQLQQVFARDWLYATGEALLDDRFYPEPPAGGAVSAHVVADGPDDDVDTFQTVLVAVVGQARQRITVATPYFVPPEPITASLEAAARRGVRVRLMVAGRGNFPWTLHAGRAHYEMLLKAGVEIFEYQKGLYHPKTITVDGCWSLVGTANLDFRSLILNFELGVSLFDAGVAGQLEQQFERDLQFARRIDLAEWLERPRRTVLLEQFWRLFAPLL